MFQGGYLIWDYNFENNGKFIKFANGLIVMERNMPKEEILKSFNYRAGSNRGFTAELHIIETKCKLRSW